MKKAQPFGWTFYGAGDEPSPPRAPGTPMVALPSSRQCPTVRRTVGWNGSSLVTRKKAQPFGWTFYGAGDEATPPRAPGTPMVALPSSRQCPTVHRTVGWNRSSLVTRRKKAQPFGWTFYGAGDEARTRYLHLGKVALYRMSYTRIGKPAADLRNRIPSIPTNR